MTLSTARLMINFLFRWYRAIVRRINNTVIVSDEQDGSKRRVRLTPDDHLADQRIALMISLKIATPERGSGCV